MQIFFTLRIYYNNLLTKHTNLRPNFSSIWDKSVIIIHNLNSENTKYTSHWINPRRIPHVTLKKCHTKLKHVLSCPKISYLVKYLWTDLLLESFIFVRLKLKLKIKQNKVSSLINSVKSIFKQKWPIIHPWIASKSTTQNCK